MTRSPLLWLTAGLVAGTLVAAGALFAQTSKRDATSTLGAAVGAVGPESALPFDIVDTPGSTYLLNRTTGQVWRLSFTDVGGNKYWYGVHVPVQPPGSFEEFQGRVRKELTGTPP